MKKETYDDAYFASLTTQQLEEMIDLGLELPSQENRKALLRILEVLEERENDAIVQKAWEEFQLYYNSPERKGKERYYFDEAALEEEEARETGEAVEPQSFHFPRMCCRPGGPSDHHPYVWHHGGCPGRGDKRVWNFGGVDR